MPVHIILDFETSSDVDLIEKGAYIYAQAPSTRILCFAWALSTNSSKVHLWKEGDEFPKKLFQVLAENDYLFFAFNANFEYLIWNNVGMKRYGFPAFLRINRCRCLAVTSRFFRLGRTLDEVAFTLNCSELKDTQKAKAMKKLSDLTTLQQIEEVIQDKKEQAVEYQQLFEALYEYCIQDVRATIQIWKVLPALPSVEQLAWELDYEINKKGVCIDNDLLQSLSILVQAFEEYTEKGLQELTEGKITKGTQSKRIADLIQETVDADTHRALISDPKNLTETGALSVGKKLLPKYLLILKKYPQLCEIITKRLEMLNLTSIKKVCKADKYKNSSGRIQGLLRFMYAKTHRWTSHKLQIHNFPRSSSNVEEIKEHVKRVVFRLQTSGTTLSQAMKNEGVDSVSFLRNVSGILRACIIASPNHILIGGDFSGIEARCYAYLSDDKDRLNDLNNGVDVYKKQIATIFNKPIEEVTAEERTIGKLLVLSCNYGLGKNALYTTLQEQGIDLDINKVSSILSRYRNDHTYSFWNKLKSCLCMAVRSKSTSASYQVTSKVFVQNLRIAGQTIPCIHYKGQFLKTAHWSYLPLYGLEIDLGQDLCFRRKVRTGTPIIKEENEFEEFSESMQVTSSLDRNTLIIENFTSPGGLTGELTQKFARDILNFKLLEIQRRLGDKLDILFHVHDEIVCEVFQDNHVDTILQDFEQVMTSSISTHPELLLRSECWKSQYYNK